MLDTPNCLHPVSPFECSYLASITMGTSVDNDGQQIEMVTCYVLGSGVFGTPFKSFGCIVHAVRFYTPDMLIGVFCKLTYI